MPSRQKRNASDSAPTNSGSMPRILLRCSADSDTENVTRAYLIFDDPRASPRYKRNPLTRKSLLSEPVLALPLTNTCRISANPCSWCRSKSSRTIPQFLRCRTDRIGRPRSRLPTDASAEPGEQRRHGKIPRLGEPG